MEKKMRTAELVEELAQREGIKKVAVDAYRDETITVNGPVVILVVED